MKMRFLSNYRTLTFSLPLLLLSSISLQIFAQVAQDKGLNCSGVMALSGGASASSNHLRYYDNLNRVHKLFPDRPIANFVATGKEDDKVTLIYESLAYKNPITDKKHWVKKMKLDADGVPLLTSQKVPGGIQGAASYEDLKQVAQNWTKDKVMSRNQGPLLFYVTDHGRLADGEGGVVSLWDRKFLSPKELNNVLGLLPSEQKVIMVFDQCYGGDMLRAMWGEDGKIRPNTCGFAASSPGQMAYGGGGLMRNLENLMQKSKKIPEGLTYEDMYKSLKNDPALYSSPMLSSDYFGYHWLQKNIVESTLISTQAKNLDSSRMACLKNFDTLDNLKLLQTGLAPQMMTDLEKDWNTMSADIKSTFGTFAKFSQAEKEVEDLKKKMDEDEEATNKYLADVFNPHMTKFAQKHYPHYKTYKALKDRVNKGEVLTEEEKQQLIKFQFDITLYKKGVEDEAELKGKKAKITYTINPDKATVEIVTKKQDLSSADGSSTIAYRKAKALFNKVTTLSALDQMIKKNDVEAIKSYMAIRECEKTSLQ